MTEKTPRGQSYRSGFPHLQLLHFRRTGKLQLALEKVLQNTDKY